MAVESKANIPDKETLVKMRDAFTLRIGDLWDAHIDEALTLLKEAESSEVTLNFACELNFKESVPKMKSRLRFTRSYTDERDDEFDPNQTEMGGLVDAAKAEGSRRRGRKAKPAAEVKEGLTVLA